MNYVTIISKGMSVFVIYFLTLFAKYKNIINVVKFISFINFDQIMMRIYSNFSISIISITFG